MFSSDCRVCVVHDCPSNRSKSPRVKFQVARILAQTSTTHRGDAVEAMRALRSAIKSDASLVRNLSSDPLFDPLRERADYQELLSAATILNRS